MKFREWRMYFFNKMVNFDPTKGTKAVLGF
jgi:hypothetical protein